MTRLNVLRNKINDEFLTLIERKVIKDKKAYLATDLLEEFADLSAKNGLDWEYFTIKCTYELRIQLQ